uniref:Uncharacterized protein n=1 Tax=Utricularia reniformis TaxID=192314 RepID=A0A1Y0B4N1_9LAMI|nr:hypothetical protein AEK19_MT2202 [Utricularia reniformis]ART32348.1 hypothetical protein AEK19_MT2202 [Utricularia reniformis]
MTITGGKQPLSYEIVCSTEEDDLVLSGLLEIKLLFVNSTLIEYGFDPFLKIFKE